MPEGPEIKLNQDILNEVLLHKKLIDINILSGKYLDKPDKFKTTISGYKKFKTILPTKITKVGRKGKFIWLETDNGWYFGIGFGMTGRISQDETADHHRVELLIENEAPVYYNDTRNFGNWYFWDDIKCLQKKLNELGPDLMDDDLSKNDVVNLFRQPKYNKKEISGVLLSGKVLSGIGNYLRAESLYDAKIWPYAKIEDLSDTDLYNLYKSLVKIAHKSYQTQIKWLNEERSYDDFQDYMKVYRKTHDQLGNPVIRSADKRTTWWVEKVQVKGK